MHKPVMGDLLCRRWGPIAFAESGSTIEPDWWDPDEEGLCIWAAYKPKGAADLATSYLDLSGNGNNSGPGVAPTWDDINGWKFNGTTQYLVTSFAIQTDQSQSVLIQFTNASSGSGKALFGWSQGASRTFQLMPNWSGTQRAYSNGGNLFIAGMVAGGNMAIAGAAGYYNGAQDAGSMAGYAACTPLGCYIGARNNAGAPENFIAVYIQAIAIYDCTLTAGQVSTIATAMSAL